MNKVSWPSRSTWEQARTHREYVRLDNWPPIETFTTAQERAGWIARIERDKAAEVHGRYAKAYNELIDMVNGAKRNYGFDVPLGDYEVRRELIDRLDAAHKDAARRFVDDPASRLPVDDEAWEDELRRRADFEHWLETGEPIKTTTQPEFVSYWGTLNRMVNARLCNESAVAKDLVDFESEVEHEMQHMCIDVFGYADAAEWAERMRAATQAARQRVAADTSVHAYLRARGATIDHAINENRY